MTYVLFFLSGCNFGLALNPINEAKWYNVIVGIGCLIAGLIRGGII